MPHQTGRSKDMDIVYVVKNSLSNDSEELRYSLRSLRNVPHKHVYVVGEKPDWVSDVEFIQVPQDGPKIDNVMNSILTAASLDGVSEDFILMNDDFFFMKKIHKVPSMNFGQLSEVIAEYMRRYPEGSRYIDSMRQAQRLLLERGIKNPISYELHTPMVLNKRKIVDMLRREQWPFHLRTYYGNIYETGGARSDDVKIFVDQRHNPESYCQDPEGYLGEQLFLSATGSSFKHELVGDFVRLQFPEPSVHEI